MTSVVGFHVVIGQGEREGYLGMAVRQDPLRTNELRNSADSYNYQMTLLKRLDKRPLMQNPYWKWMYRASRRQKPHDSTLQLRLNRYAAFSLVGFGRTRLSNAPSNYVCRSLAHQ
jgi:hypothetical protein